MTWDMSSSTSRPSLPGLSTDNIIEGGRKRTRIDHDVNNSNSPILRGRKSLSRLSSTPGPGNAAAEEDKEASRAKAIEQGWRLLDYVLHRFEPPDKTQLCLPFITLPSREEYPDYYEQIKTPTSLELVRRRLLAGEYNTLEDVRDALFRIWNNAKRYNQKDSPIYDSARILHGATREAYVALVEDDDVPQPEDGGKVNFDEPGLQRSSELIVKLETPEQRARLDYNENKDGAPQLIIRLKLPTDEEYEEDYEDEGNEDDKDDEKERDKEEAKEKALPTDKADASNAPETTSNTFTIAQAQDDVSMTDINKEEGNAVPASRSAPLAAKSVAGWPTPAGSESQSMAKLPRPGSRRRGAPRAKRLKSTLRILVQEMKQIKLDDGSLLCQEFFDLPSKDDFPDYYKVIKEPMSLRMIDEKAMRNGYENSYALIKDLRKMVENAKYFNEDNSGIWKCADDIEKHIDKVMIPSLLQDGFTMHPYDFRDQHLPGDPIPTSFPEPGSEEEKKQLAEEEAAAAAALAARQRQSSARAAGVPAQAPVSRQNHSQSPYPQMGNGAPGGVTLQQQQGYPFPPNGHPGGQGVGHAMSPPAGMVPVRPGFAPGPYGAPGTPFNQPGQMMGAGQNRFMGPPTPISRPPKRLAGDAPPDALRTTVLNLPDGRLVKRRPICKEFLCQMAKKKVRLQNNATRVHALTIAAEDADELKIDFSLAEIVRASGDEREGSPPAEGIANMPWKVIVLYNGRSVPLKRSHIAGEEGHVEEGPLRGDDGSGFVDVKQGSRCTFVVRPAQGTSVIDVTIRPAPPNSLLADIAAGVEPINSTSSSSLEQDTKPDGQVYIQARAKAMLNLPDRYRIFVNNRTRA